MTNDVQWLILAPDMDNGSEVCCAVPDEATGRDLVQRMNDSKMIRCGDFFLESVPVLTSAAQPIDVLYLWRIFPDDPAADTTNFPLHDDIMVCWPYQEHWYGHDPVGHRVVRLRGPQYVCDAMHVTVAGTDHAAVRARFAELTTPESLTGFIAAQNEVNP